MLITTLCYIEYKGRTLMLHRVKKKDDINEGKWIGVGGKFLDRESPEECLIREVREETGWQLTGWRLRGFITFLQENYETEYMCLYSGDDFLVPSDAKASGSAEHLSPAEHTAAAPGAHQWVPVREHPAFACEDAALWPVPDCDEGELAWIPNEEIPSLSLWAGDRIFLKLLNENQQFFSLKLLYKGDELLEAVLDGEPISAGI